MRRFLLAVVCTLFVWTSDPPPAAAQTANDHAFCEAYCLAVVGGCYAFLGLVFGREKCDKMYEGCSSGCHLAVADE